MAFNHQVFVSLSKSLSSINKFRSIIGFIEQIFGSLCLQSTSLSKSLVSINKSLYPPFSIFWAWDQHCIQLLGCLSRCLRGLAQGPSGNPKGRKSNPQPSDHQPKTSNTWATTSLVQNIISLFYTINLHIKTQNHIDVSSQWCKKVFPLHCMILSLNPDASRLCIGKQHWLCLLAGRDSITLSVVNYSKASHGCVWSHVCGITLVGSCCVMGSVGEWVGIGKGKRMGTVIILFLYILWMENDLLFNQPESN